MGKASILAAISTAIVAGELAGWMLNIGPLVVAKAVMLGALVCFHCLKQNGSPNSHAQPAGQESWPKRHQAINFRELRQRDTARPQRDSQLAA